MKQLFSNYIFENPLPQLYAKGSAFPNVCELEPEHLIAAHQIGQAFESVDGTTYLSESLDGGRTWSAPQRVFPASENSRPMSDCAKISRLPDGRLALLGYTFYRDNPDLPLANPETGGLLDDEVFYAVSVDHGKTWTKKLMVPTTWNGHTEASAPLYILQDGSWATPIAPFPKWDGTFTSRVCGRLLRSTDQGKTWDDATVCMEFPGDGTTCYEQRMCQMRDGMLVVIGWNEDLKSGRLLNNHVTISTDNGKTFSLPIDTNIHGQASSILALDDTHVLSLHALRRDTDRPGIYACIADVSGGKWNAECVECIWEPQTPIVKNDKMAEIFAFLKFGQPGGVLLSDGSVMMTHWVCEEGIYKTVATRLSI